MKDQSRLIIDRQQEFLEFLKSRFHVFHESNVFFRDLHYGVMGYLALRKLSCRYTESEKVTRNVVEAFVEARRFIPIDGQTWMLNYPAFKTASSKPVVSSKLTVVAAQPVPAVVSQQVASFDASASTARH